MAEGCIEEMVNIYKIKYADMKFRQDQQIKKLAAIGIRSLVYYECEWQKAKSNDFNGVARFLSNFREYYFPNFVPRHGLKVHCL